MTINTQAGVGVYGQPGSENYSDSIYSEWNDKRSGWKKDQGFDGSATLIEYCEGIRDATVKRRRTPSPTLIEDCVGIHEIPVKWIQYPDASALEDVRESPRTGFVVMQEWECYVTEVSEETFVARMAPVNGLRDEDSVPYPDEGEFPIDGLGGLERKRLIAGAAFRWSVGYTYEGESRRHDHRLAFRNPPVEGNKVSVSQENRTLVFETE